MKMRENERPKGLAGAIPSYQWKERADYKKENRDWLKNSRRVALRVLDVLDEKEMTQQTLADLLKVSRQQVSKIVKGQENFTFETVAKLENALGIILMDIYDGKEEVVVTERNILAEQHASVTKKIEAITNKHSSKSFSEITSESFHQQFQYDTERRKEFFAGESDYAKAS